MALVVPTLVGMNKDQNSPLPFLSLLRSSSVRLRPERVGRGAGAAPGRREAGPEEEGSHQARQGGKADQGAQVRGKVLQAAILLLFLPGILVVSEQ